MKQTELDQLLEKRDARRAEIEGEVVEIVRQWIADGAEVIVKGSRGCFGGIYQWYDAKLGGASLGWDLLKRGDKWRDALTSPEVQAVLAAHTTQPLLDTESEQAAAYWRAVNG